MSVLKYLSYAKDRARFWIAKYPRLADEIMGTAFLTLVEVFNTREDGPDIKGYISTAIDNRVIGFLRLNDMIPLPWSEVARRKGIGFDDVIKRVFIEDELLFNSRKASCHPPWMSIYLQDVLGLLNLTEHERAVLELRETNHSLSEISSKLGKAKSSLSETLTHIKDRYLRLLRTHPELLRPDGY